MGKNEIRTTRDYHLFKLMPGNRAIKNRAENIKESIEKIGWISNPIIVNQDMEIIDGQSRFIALRDLNKPIEYQVIPHLNLDDCRTLNRYNTEWGTIDYLYSYAEEGNVNYIRLKNLMETFGEKQIRIVLQACSKSYHKDEFQEGRTIVTDKDFGNGYRRLNILGRFKDISKRFSGRSITKAPAFFFIADQKDIDIDYLESVLSTCNPDEIYTDSLVHFLESIQKVYNKNRVRKNRIHIAEDYKKEMM